jgi:LuxR family maltose regulon positive regulatory protein
MGTATSRQHLPVGPESPIFAASKFLTPPSPARHVRRHALTRRIDSNAPIVLMVAPPGAGKTALLADWAGSNPGRLTAWLHVDDSDRDPARFWPAFVAAVRTCSPAFAPQFPDLLRLNADVDRDVLEYLLECAGALDVPVSLVVDDLQHVSAPVYDGLRFLVSRDMGNLGLVIGTRTEPQIDLQRLRLDARVIELRESDLRFSRRDAARLLEGLGVSIPDDCFDTVYDRTEGWAAGLQLAALVLRESDDVRGAVDRLRGTNQVIAQYLAAEVFSAQSPDMQRFLLDTCVVDEITVGIAQALCPDSPVNLLDVENAQLFLRRIDVDGKTFRFHNFVTDLLRFHLRAIDAPHETVLHERAARWYEHHADPVAAFRHYWKAGRHDLALHLVHRAALDVVFVSLPEMTMIERSLGNDDIEADPAAAASFALALMVSGLAAEGHRLAARVRDASPGAQHVDLRDQAVAVEAMSELVLGDTVSTIARVGELSEGHDPNATWPHLARLASSQARIWEGELDRATEEIRCLYHPGASRLVQMELAGMAAHIELASGELVALSKTLDSLDTMLQPEGEGPPEVADGIFNRALRGALKAERADFTAAESVLVPVREMRSAFRTGAMTIANVALSRLWTVDGRLDAAAVALGEVHDLVGPDPPRSGLLDHARTQEIHLLVAAGDCDEAKARMCEISSPTLRSRLGAIVAMAEGATDEARQFVDEAAVDPPRTKRDRLECALLDARLAHAYGESIEPHLAPALDVAASEGLLLPLVEAGGDVLDVIQAMARKLPKNDSVSAILRLRPGVVTHGERPTNGADALTRREQVILRYMASSMTYREIADELFISLNTVKTHVKHINRKLDATSRRDAIRKAKVQHYL